VARLLLRDLHGLLSGKGSRVITKMAHISEEFNTNDYDAISYTHASVLTDLAKRLRKVLCTCLPHQKSICRHLTAVRGKCI
jgi:hypothetical protein